MSADLFCSEVTDPNQADSDTLPASSASTDWDIYIHKND